MSGYQITQRAFEARPVNRARVIEIELCAARRGEVRAVAIKIILREPAGLRAKKRLEFVRQPGLAGAAASDYGDHDW